MWQDGAEFGYNKANEWHYVKDGDLPEAERKVIVMRENDVIDFDKYFKNWGWQKNVLGETMSKVIAWKEIVLPKESE